MGHLYESGVKWRWKKKRKEKGSLCFGRKSRDSEEQRKDRRLWMEGWQKRGKGCTGAAPCAALRVGEGLCLAVRGVTLTAEPERSLIWHVWCGPAPAIHPFVVPPHWAAWQWSAKQQWQRGPTIRMANLLMHHRADSLTFLFTIQSGCEGGRDEKRGSGATTTT